MDADALWREFNAARAEMTPPDRALLEGHGVRPGNVLFLVGITRARVHAGLYEPDYNGGTAYLTPALTHDPITPESSCATQAVRFGDIVDLVAWHPRRPDSFALRCGTAEWLGAIEPQYLNPTKVPIRRTVLGWFQSDCTGLVLLSRQPADQYRLLLNLRAGIEAEDATHADELLRVLRQPRPVPPVSIAPGPGRRHAA